MQSKQDSHNNGVAESAVSRVLRMMEELWGAPSALTMTELARRVALPKSTTVRLLATLCRDGMARRVGHHYLPGPHLHTLITGPAQRTSSLRRCLTPFVSAVYERTRHTTGLAVLRGTEVQFVVRFGHHHGIWTPADKSGLAPAHATAAGKLLLAFHPQAADRYATLGLLTPVTSHTITSTIRFHAELERVRRQRLAMNREESTPQVCCVAVPITSITGKAVAALTVATGVDEPNFQRTVPLLRQAALAGSIVFRQTLEADPGNDFQA